MKTRVLSATFAAGVLCATTAAFVTAAPAQPAQEAEPMSVKPDAGINWDSAVPLPPIPDGGPLPQTRDASVPLNDPAHAAAISM